MSEQPTTQSGQERLAEFDALGRQAEGAARAHLEAPGTVPEGTPDDIADAQRTVSEQARTGQIIVKDGRGAPTSTFQEFSPTAVGGDSPQTVVRRFETGAEVAGAEYPYRDTAGRVAVSNELYGGSQAEAQQ